MSNYIEKVLDFGLMWFVIVWFGFWILVVNSMIPCGFFRYPCYITHLLPSTFTIRSSPFLISVRLCRLNCWGAG